MTEVAQTLGRASTVRESILKLMQGEYLDDRRTTTVLAYADLALEHHEAIEYLIQRQKFSSACALARPVVEALFRALWVNSCATDDELEEFASDHNFEFPHDMMAAIDAKYSQEDRFFSTIKRGCWSVLCDYAHGGLTQLAHRFRGRRVEPNFSEAELLEVVWATTSAIILVGRLLMMAAARGREAKEMETLMLAWARA